MATIIECKKLTYNWRQAGSAVGDLSVMEVKSDVYEVDKDGVTEIQKYGEAHFVVFFSDGHVVHIYNPNKAEFFPIKPEDNKS